MAAFQILLSGLRRAEQQLEKQLAGVRDAIVSLGGSGSGARRGRPAGSKNRAAGRKKGPGKRKRRKMSAATKAKMRVSQQKRWAAKKAGDKK